MVTMPVVVNLLLRTKSHFVASEISYFLWKLIIKLASVPKNKARERSFFSKEYNAFFHPIHLA